MIPAQQQSKHFVADAMSTGHHENRCSSEKQTFSIMGLVVSPGGDSNLLPAADPEMIRMLPNVA